MQFSAALIFSILQYPSPGLPGRLNTKDLEDAVGAAQPGLKQSAKPGLALQTSLLLPSAGKIPHGYSQTWAGVSVPVTEILGAFSAFYGFFFFFPLGPCVVPKNNLCCYRSLHSETPLTNVRAKQFFQIKSALSLLPEMA